MTQQALVSASQPHLIQKIQETAHLLLPASLGLLLFFLPISSTGKSVFLWLSTVLILMLMAIEKEKAIAAFRHPLSLLGLVLFVWIVIAMSWSSATLAEQLSSVKHYSKLLFLPLFLFAFDETKRCRWVIPGFFLALLLILLLSLLNLSGLTHWYVLDPTAMFRNHIITSFMMAVGSFTAATYALKAPRFKGLYALLALVFATHILFLNTGRMGYLIFFALSLVFLIQHMAKKQWFIGLIVGLLILGGVISQSNVIQKQWIITQHHLSIYQKGEKETSVGLRFQFYKFASEAIAQKPLLGHGTGSYHALFNQSGHFKPDSVGCDDPHNQYLFTWFEQGLIGLLIFLAFLGYAFFQGTKKLPPQRRFLTQGLIIAFTMGSMTDSYLFYSGTGFLFCILIAFFMTRHSAEPS